MEGLLGESMVTRPANSEDIWQMTPVYVTKTPPEIADHPVGAPYYKWRWEVQTRIKD